MVGRGYGRRDSGDMLDFMLGTDAILKIVWLGYVRLYGRNSGLFQIAWKVGWQYVKFYGRLVLGYVKL